MIALFRACLVVSMLTLSACDSNEEVKVDEPVSTVDQEELLRERVDSRWANIKSRNFDTVYTYFSPVYRKINTLESYRRKTGSVVDWTSVEINDVTISENVASITINASYRLALPSGMSLGKSVGEVSKRIDERWIFKENQWWYVPKETGSNI